jgi:type IV pilus assembly protein PilE
MLSRPISRIARAAPAGGFTLIEVMIAVVIVSILAAIAVPQYTEFVMRSRIMEATSGLNDFRVRMEQYFQDNRTYLNAGNCGVSFPPPGANDYFQFACVPGALAGEYTVTAAGLGSMNAFGYSLAITNAAGIVRATTGVPAGWAASANCWTVRRNGKCS